MTITTQHLTIQDLFELNPTFVIPKYQRGYAWNEEAIYDFVSDLEKCFNARLKNQGTPQSQGIHHFFGGVVTVELPVTGSNRANFEIIDGQQRMSSFRMLVATIIEKLQELSKELKDRAEKLTQDESKALSYFTETISELTKKYMSYKDKINLEYVLIPKLTMSEADQAFFQDLTSGKSPAPSRSSHERILHAWKELRSFVNKIASDSKQSLDKAKRIGCLIDDVLGKDCTVIFMRSTVRSEAYQIFQVLNDRGVHLSNGDLLRARTLEALEGNQFSEFQAKVSHAWDNILAYSPAENNDNLNWYFASHQGSRPKPTSFVEDFIKVRFPSSESQTTHLTADDILTEAKLIERACEHLHKLSEGQWPSEDSPQVLQWDQERLRMLVVHLKHTNAMPLLLSLFECKPELFAEAIASIERFVFRYKTIGNAHIGAATSLYQRHAKEIRDNPQYSFKALRKDLTDLVLKNVPDDLFSAALRKLSYSKKQGNSHLRYYFITLEDYYSWAEGPAQGQPKCKDKSRVTDFNNTTLEHIYPQEASKGQLVEFLEHIKNSIGNLTIFGPGDNIAMGNKPFPEKKAVLSKSSMRINRDISQFNEWTADSVSKRTDQLINMSLKIFVP